MPARRGRAVILLAAATLLALAFLGGVAWRNWRGGTVSESEFLFGTYVQVTATGRGARDAVARAMERMREIEGYLNPVRPGSDIARLAAGAGAPVAVSPDTLTVLERADEAYRLSGGAFDLTVGPLVSVWGFGPQDPTAVGAPADGQLSAPPDGFAIEAARLLTGWSGVSWNRAAGTAALNRPGMSLTTGGLGKGYAIDEAVRLLRDAGVKEAVIDAGGEVYLIGRKKGGQAWRIGVRHPRQDGYLGALELPPDVAVATSGDYQRFFESQGRRFHHIVDPVTGWPAVGCQSVTVVARTGVEADYLSTALFVLGPEKGFALAERLPGVEALFVDADGRLKLTSGLRDIFVPAAGGAGDD